MLVIESLAVGVCFDSFAAGGGGRMPASTISFSVFFCACGGDCCRVAESSDGLDDHVVHCSCVEEANGGSASKATALPLPILTSLARILHIRNILRSPSPLSPPSSPLRPARVHQVRGLIFFQSLSIELPLIAFSPSTVEGDFRAGAVDVSVADPNKHELKKSYVATKCKRAVDCGIRRYSILGMMRAACGAGYHLGGKRNVSF